MEPKNELDLCRMLLIMHLRGFVYELRQLPPDKWDWTPDVPEPPNDPEAFCAAFEAETENWN